MNNTIETKEHIMFWIKDITFNFGLRYLDLKKCNELDDNTINEMLEQTVKLQSYLEKVKSGKYE